MRTFFMIVLLLAGLFAALFGFGAFTAAKSAIHEIEALICGLIVTIAVAAGYIALALEAAHAEQAAQQKRTNDLLQAVATSNHELTKRFGG